MSQRIMLWSTALITTLGIVTGVPGAILAQTPRPSTEPLMEFLEQISKLKDTESLTQQATQLSEQGEVATAISLFESIVAIQEQLLGSEHPIVALGLTTLAGFYELTDNYTKAETLLQRALNIAEKAFGSEHANVATIIENLGKIYYLKGNYAQAEPQLQRALAIREKAFGSQHPNVAVSFDSLGTMYYFKGDYAQAESLYNRALAIREKAFGVQHPNVILSLDNLALVYQVTSKYTLAEALYKRSLAIQEKTLGSQHPEVARNLNQLAILYYKMGNYAQAESLYQRALAIREKALDSDYYNVAIILSNLAQVYQKTGNYAQAESRYQRVLNLLEKNTSPEHPLVVEAIINLASTYLAKGDIPRALEFQTRSVNLQEQYLATNLSIGTESQKAAFINNIAKETNATLSLHLQNAPNNLEAARLALTTILRRKGRIQEAITESLITLRQNLTPENQILLDKLNTTRSQLAALIFNKPRNVPLEQYRNQVAILKTQVEKQEAELARRSTEFLKISQPASIEAVQKLIPQNTALIEFMLYKPYDAKNDKLGNPRYVVYILNASGNIQWVDLGAAEPINQAVTEFRQALQSQSPTIQKIARSLDEKLMQPIRQRLGNTRTLLISPDSQLNLIPFAALVDENNRYLVENYAINYLGSGRDLLRLQNRVVSRSNPVLLANPDYSNPGSPSVQVASRGGSSPSNSAQTSNLSLGNNTRRSSDLAQIKFGPLPGTLKEAAAIAPLLARVEQLTGSQATENALKQVKSPYILHIATHGFFLEDVELVAPSTGLSRSLWVEPDFNVKPSRPVAGNQENPLLRSGLAMAGFNIRKSGDEDGVLTAMEAAALNLWGTKLVVLSACETGVGDVANGEGVFGLRRAFAIAGAESQVLSLWKVDDEGTKDLMVNYYRRLLNNEGRSEALRQIQLEMLRSQKYQHPYYWASFIPSGDWTPMGSISQ